MSPPNSASGPKHEHDYQLGDFELAAPQRPSGPIEKGTLVHDEVDLDEPLPELTRPAATPSNDVALLDDHFGDALSGPALDLEVLAATPVPVPSATRATGPSEAVARSELSTRPADDVRAARALAGFGIPPTGLACAGYVPHVIRRMLALRRERKALEGVTSERAERYEVALAALGRAIYADPALRESEALKDAHAVVEARERALFEVEEATREARAHEASALEMLASESAVLEEQLAPYVTEERTAAATLARIESEIERRKAQRKRADIELRALAKASVRPPPGRSEEIESERARRSEELTALLAERDGASAALGRARRDLALRRGALDAMKREHAQRAHESHTRKDKLDGDVASAEQALSVALCELADAADRLGLLDASDPQVAVLRESEAALDGVVARLTLYDRALTLYDRDALVRGALLWAGLLLALLLVIRLL